MAASRVLLLAALIIAGCARPDDSRAIVPTSPTPLDAPPYRRLPVDPPFSGQSPLLAERVEEQVRLYDRDRWERWVDAADPGEFSTDLRLTQESIDRGEWKPEWLFQNGDEIFEHEIGVDEGFGPGRSRVHRKGLGGPDAAACAECHHRGGFNGSGDLSENAYFEGDGTDPSSAFERNPPALLGLGPEQRLAEEMTSDLQQIRNSLLLSAKFSKRNQTVALASKGIRFGELRASPDGVLDTTHVEGVDPDLVIKPFGWKGNFPDLRAFVVGGFQAHFGIQLAGMESAGSGPAWDRDGDGKPDEINDGMISTIVVYLARLEIPVIVPPRDLGLLSRHARGRDLFDRIGCAACHVPALPLLDPKLRVSSALKVDVVADGERPRPRHDVFGAGINGIPIFLFSDLKRHHLGRGLAENRPTDERINAYDPLHHTAHLDVEIAADEFLTRPLWGLAESAPYMHDGRARTIDDAILSHGGEAAAAAHSFEALPENDKTDLRIFLLSLSRYPRIDYR